MTKQNNWKLITFAGLILLIGFFIPNQFLVREETDSQKPVYRSPHHISLSADGLRAYVINQTSNSVSIIDVSARKVVGEISVGNFPTYSALSPDEQTLYITCQHDNIVQYIDLQKQSIVRSIPTGFHPFGLEISSDGRTLYVANSTSNTVSILDVETGKTVFEIPVGRDPRYITKIPGDTRILVSTNLARNVVTIDPKTGDILETRDLGRVNMLKQIVCSHDGRWAFVPHVMSHDEQITMQMERGWINSNGFTVMDLHTEGHYVTILLDHLLAGATNPWATAITSDDLRLYISLAGIKKIAFVDVPKAMKLVAETEPHEVPRLSQDVDILQKRKIARRVNACGIGPRSLALNEATGELLIANYFNDAVSIIHAVTGDSLANIPLGPPQEFTLHRKGEMLANDGFVCFQQWMSCGSCHQEDGTMDALNWDLINDGIGNPKNAKSLHDSYDTPPSMWRGVRADMDAAVAAGQRFLGFIPKPENHRALLAFFGSPPRAPNPYRYNNLEALRNGEKIFYRARCYPCHPPPTFTDLKKHDLDLAGETDMKSRFVTPSLRDCYRTEPYFHHGEAKTLHEIFTKYNPDDLHGLTSQLTEEELDNLIEYLRSL